MFEDYLEDASYFLLKANRLRNDREAKRYYRASVFYTVGAIEAFVNYIADTITRGRSSQPFEIAFLTDRRFQFDKGTFKILRQPEYHRLEDKLRLLLCKFVPDFDFNKDASWSRLLAFKNLRDVIMHPRSEEDEMRIVEYKRSATNGLSSMIEIMNRLCQGIFGRPLRKKIVELRPLRRSAA